MRLKGTAGLNTILKIFKIKNKCMGGRVWKTQHQDLKASMRNASDKVNKHSVEKVHFILSAWLPRADLKFSNNKAQTQARQQGLARSKKEIPQKRRIQLSRNAGRTSTPKPNSPRKPGGPRAGPGFLQGPGHPEATQRGNVTQESPGLAAA